MSLRFASSARLAAYALLSCAACATGATAPDAGPPIDGASASDASESGGIDGSLSCPTEPCDLLEQCGCSVTEVCDLDSTDLENAATRCREVLVPGTAAASCESSTGCAGGFVCLGGHCREYCDDTADCGDGHCAVEISDGAGGVVPGVAVCTKVCSPERSTDNGCPASPQFACHIFVVNPDGMPASGDEYFATDCTRPPAAGGGHDADCSDLGHAGCQPGFDCANVSGVGQRCRQNCLYPTGTCTIGTCTAYSAPQPNIDGAEYGFCQ